MKFTTEKDSLIKEITTAHEIISSRNALSILSNVLLDAKDNTLTVRATDLKVSFETSIPVEVSNPGTTTVFCDKFLSILRSLPAGEIEFEEDDQNTLVIRPLFKKIDFRLKTIGADKYPEIQLTTDSPYFEFSQADFVDMIGQTVFAVSDDETRYFMNGVYFETVDGKLTMVATDGRRLSFVSRGTDQPVGDFDGVIVPPKVLTLVRRLVSGEGPLSVAITDKHVYFSFDNLRVSSSLIEGQFPNYKRVIPDGQEYSLTVNREELLEALKRVSLLVEKSRRVYIGLDDGLLTVNSEESEIGLAKEEVSCNYDGPEMTLALNYVYLMDPLRVITEEEVAVHFTESNRAISIYSVPEHDYFHIVMPMNLD
jgi:DNA polymerase-3 subunit beta